MGQAGEKENRLLEVCRLYYVVIEFVPSVCQSGNLTTSPALEVSSVKKLKEFCSHFVWGGVRGDRKNSPQLLSGLIRTAIVNGNI